MSISKKQLDDRLDQARDQADEKNNQQNVTLLTIQTRLEDANRQIESGNSILGKVTDALRLDWLRQLGSDLKALMRRAIATNIATYQAVLSIQAILPSRLERTMIEEPFILEDPIGRIAPVHLQFVTSWDAFNAVLEVRFRDIQGYKKIKQRQYGLQDKSTGRDIVQTRRWDGAFLPGQRIEMSLLFETKASPVSDNSHATCPGCQATSAGGNEADIQCERCGMWFRRITVIREVEPPPPVPLPKPWSAKPQFGKSTMAFQLVGPLKPGRKRTAPDDLEGEEEAREFKRVRIIQAKEQIKMRKFGQNGSGNSYATFSTLQGSESVKKTPWQGPSAHGAALHDSMSELEKFRQQMSALKPRSGYKDVPEAKDDAWLSALIGDPLDLEPKSVYQGTEKNGPGKYSEAENNQMHEESYMKADEDAETEKSSTEPLRYARDLTTDQEASFIKRNPHSSAALETTIYSKGPLFRWKYSPLVTIYDTMIGWLPPASPPVDPWLYDLLELDSWHVSTLEIVVTYEQRIQECLSCGSLNTACFAAAEQLKDVLDCILENLVDDQKRVDYHRTGLIPSFPQDLFPFIQDAIDNRRLVEAVERLCRCQTPCSKVWTIWEIEEAKRRGFGFKSKNWMRYYGLLGLQRNATQAEIKRNYRLQAIMNHPDKNPDDKVTLRRFEEVQEAYLILGDELSRALYDVKGVVPRQLRRKLNGEVEEPSLYDAWDDLWTARLFG